MFISWQCVRSMYLVHITVAKHTQTCFLLANAIFVFRQGSTVTKISYYPWCYPPFSSCFMIGQLKPIFEGGFRQRETFGRMFAGLILILRDASRKIANSSIPVTSNIGVGALNCFVCILGHKKYHREVATTSTGATGNYSGHQAESSRKIGCLGRSE